MKYHVKYTNDMILNMNNTEFLLYFREDIKNFLLIKFNLI